MLILVKTSNKYKSLLVWYTEGLLTVQIAGNWKCCEKQQESPITRGRLSIYSSRQVWSSWRHAFPFALLACRVWDEPRSSEIYSNPGQMVKYNSMLAVLSLMKQSSRLVEGDWCLNLWNFFSIWVSPAIGSVTPNTKQSVSLQQP